MLLLLFVDANVDMGLLFVLGGGSEFGSYWCMRAFGLL